MHARSLFLSLTHILYTLSLKCVLCCIFLRTVAAQLQESVRMNRVHIRMLRRAANKKKGGAFEAPGAAAHRRPPPPAALKARRGSAPLPPGWEELRDDASGDAYYSNTALGVTSWDRPVDKSAIPIL